MCSLIPNDMCAHMYMHALNLKKNVFAIGNQIKTGAEQAKHT